MGLLRHPADRRSVGFAFVHVALLGATVLAVRTDAPWWLLAFGAIPVLAASGFVQLISTHNAMHAAVFVKKPHNRLWQCVLSICIAYPASVFVPVHNLSHHLGLQTPRDVLRTTDVRHRWNLQNLVHHMAMGTVHLHALHLAYVRTMRRSHARWFAQVIREVLAVSAAYGVLVALVGPSAVVCWFLVPAVLGQLLIVGFGYVQHDGCDPDSALDHSRNFRSPLLNWFIFDNGFHTVHHDDAALHWSRCRAVHEADVAPRMHPALDQVSLARYLWRAFVWPGRRVRYDGTPIVLPAHPTRRELWTPASATANGASSGAAEG